jgi:hypothetical protein
MVLDISEDLEFGTAYFSEANNGYIEHPTARDPKASNGQ